ncbi:GNAT family N-acetyltransferase [Pseudoprimorskyibacter insulae]|uniref:N-acetyltransferase domain-containing protein n=1 Tax=Pseudoprimorskyibacter insulae TaxID=1695997 RepID=A0A2R8AN46_9RHOB|nr:GNAT family N-acetyltransferase [Pseudoprimorskyibacter insulae]SPF77468.1 hypothetical protein PRI8871_00050 [Pseudoprimorskyibacter insulae]
MDTEIRIPTLETDRLILRAPRMEDFEAYAEFSASDRSKGVGGPYNRAQAFARMGELIGHWHLRGYGRWMLECKETGAPVGTVGIFHPEGWPEPEIGWTVFAAAEGKGIAYEAALRTRQFAYDVLGWSTIISACMPHNTRSIALAKRLGCSADGTFEHEVVGPHLIWRHPSAQELSA